MFIFSYTFVLLIYMIVVIGDGQRKIRLIRGEDGQEKAPPHSKHRDLSHESSPNFVKKLLDYHLHLCVSFPLYTPEL